jgi:hypothetical protein
MKRVKSYEKYGENVTIDRVGKELFVAVSFNKDADLDTRCEHAVRLAKTVMIAHFMKWTSWSDWVNDLELKSDSYLDIHTFHIKYRDIQRAKKKNPAYKKEQESFMKWKKNAIASHGSMMKAIDTLCGMNELRYTGDYVEEDNQPASV